MKNLLLTSLLALSLSSGLLADTFTVSSVNGGAAAGSPKLNLDNLALGNSLQWADSVLKVSFTGTGQVVEGAASGLYAAPFVSGDNGVGFGSPDQPNGADTTRYLSTGIGSVILDFASHQNYFGLLWGSVDHYNTLSFYDGAALVGSFTGLHIWENANGNQGQQGTFYVNFHDLDGSFNRVVASSSQYAFELDNIAYSARPVPEGGATFAMLGIALAGLAACRRKR
ncbi:MAG TPA: VPDSG-CTERM sorting domain-containing protein [Lacunisphaera sp.]|nr:VPDSG-CTERM sorting domain-containing protein [Lacunisphaera sp.]